MNSAKKEFLYWVVWYRDEQGNVCESQEFPRSEGYEKVEEFLNAVRGADQTNGRVFSLAREA